MDFFGRHNGSVFLNDSSTVALYSNIVEKLGKNEMKIRTYTLIFKTKKTIPKKINV